MGRLCQATHWYVLQRYFEQGSNKQWSTRVWVIVVGVNINTCFNYRIAMIIALPMVVKCALTYSYSKVATDQISKDSLNKLHSHCQHAVTRFNIEQTYFRYRITHHHIRSHIIDQIRSDQISSYHISLYISSYHISPYLIIYLIISCLIISYLIILYLTISYLIISYLIILHLIIS